MGNLHQDGRGHGADDDDDDRISNYKNFGIYKTCHPLLPVMSNVDLVMDYSSPIGLMLKAGRAASKYTELVRTSTDELLKNPFLKADCSPVTGIFSRYIHPIYSC